MVVLIITEAREEEGDSKTREVEEVTPKIKANLNLIKEVEIAAAKEVVVLVLVEEKAKRSGIKEMLNASIMEKRGHYAEECWYKEKNANDEAQFATGVVSNTEPVLLMVTTKTGADAEDQ